MKIAAGWLAVLTGLCALTTGVRAGRGAVAWGGWTARRGRSSDGGGGGGDRHSPASSRRLLRGGPNNPQDCDALFGAAYMQNWRNATQQLCPFASAGTGGQCYANPVAPLVACVTTNLIMNPSAAPGRRTGLDCGPAASSPSAPELAPLPPAARPAMRGWLGQGAAAPLRPAAFAALCAAPAAVEQPALLVHRDDTTNTYHTLEYFLMVYTTLELLGKSSNPVGGFQVMFDDGSGDGPYLEFFRRLGPVRNLRTDPLANDTCLRTAIHVPPAEHAASLLTYKGIGGNAVSVGCPPSPLVTGFAAWLRNDLFPDLTGAAEKTPPRVLSVVWASRARHEKLRPNLTPWQALRRAENDAAVSAALQSEVLAWNERAAAAAAAAPPAGGRLFFEFRAIELSDLPWAEQVSALARAAVLVGTHGAGLAHQVWMETGGASAVVEAMHGVNGQKHYEGMAALLGHRYSVCRSTGSHVDTCCLAARAREAMDAVAAARPRPRGPT